MNCPSRSQGGGLAVCSATATLTNCLIYDNTATYVSPHPRTLIPWPPWKNFPGTDTLLVHVRPAVLWGEARR